MKKLTYNIKTKSFSTSKKISITNSSSPNRLFVHFFISDKGETNRNKWNYISFYVDKSTKVGDLLEYIEDTYIIDKDNDKVNSMHEFGLGGY